MLDTQGIQLIVHIGIGKTGTSSIQHYLNQVAESSNDFLFAGYLFERLQNKRYDWQRVSGTPRFVELPYEQQNAELEIALNDCINEATSRGLSKVIWSNEALCEMAWLPQMLQQLWTGTITTLCYVREPASYSVSAYYQWGIKHKIYSGEVPSYTEFVQKHHFEHHKIIEKWKAVSANFHILNYDKTENVVQTFCERLFISFDNSHCPDRQNRAPDTTQLYASAIANSLDNKPCMLELPQEWSQLSSPNERWFHSKLPTHQQIAEHVANCELDTQKLNALLMEGNDEHARLEATDIDALIKPFEEIRGCSDELALLTPALIIKHHSELRTINRHLSLQAQKTKGLEGHIKSLQTELRDMKHSQQAQARSMANMNKEIQRLSQIASKSFYARLRRYLFKLLNIAPLKNQRLL